MRLFVGTSFRIKLRNVAVVAALAFWAVYLGSFAHAASPLVQWEMTNDGTDCTVTATPQQELSALRFYVCANGDDDSTCASTGTVVDTISCGTTPLTHTFTCTSGFRVWGPSTDACKTGIAFDASGSAEGFNWSNGSPDAFDYTTSDLDDALSCTGVDDCTAPPPDDELIDPGDHGNPMTNDHGEMVVALVGSVGLALMLRPIVKRTNEAVWNVKRK